VLEDNLRVAFRRELHADQSPGDEADVSAALPQLRRAAHRALLATAAGYAALAGAGGTAEPNIVLLTPGVFNSAYFEHTYLARQMGIDLVEGRDLVTHDNNCLHAHHRRAEARGCDLSPGGRRLQRSLIFARPSLGCGGCSTLSRRQSDGDNAFGTGLADDKAVYAYVPDMIKFYLDEDPILPREDYLLSDPKQCRHVLATWTSW